MRRKDRALSRQEALDILNAGEYGILSTVSADGQPYGTPINFCLMNDFIYFHCATQGHKLDNISANNKVCFCVVGKTQVLPEQFGTLYESAVVFGAAAEVFDSEKHSALVGLIKKYSKDYYDEGLKYIEKLSSKTGVYKVSINSISGKAKK
jgi:nitroimidazol reductase NimA-like FMN-containing flavoprotein (pyridoxamine 5'-phosphate oxidase superfamily)